MSLPLSPSRIYAALELLVLVDREPVSVDRLVAELLSLSGIALAEVLQFCAAIDVVKVSTGGFMEITGAGREVLGSSTDVAKAQKLLHQYVLATAPPWSLLILRGRTETREALSRTTRQCLAEAELFANPPSSEVVEWWDSLSIALRGLQAERDLTTGRIGERLSLHIEAQRTGTQAIWRSVDTNMVGYDILSVVSSWNRLPLLIEVKASRSLIKSASFHVTASEWQIAKESPYYAIHLWSFANVPSLAVINVSDLATHIPTNQGEGEWERTRVPMNAFADKFRSVPSFQPLVETWTS